MYRISIYIILNVQVLKLKFYICMNIDMNFNILNGIHIFTLNEHLN
jgi:hypothetical protein